MLFRVTYRDPQPGHIDTSAMFVEATVEAAAEWRRLADEQPDEVLTFPRAKLHRDLDTWGRGSLRAGRIVEICSVD